MMVQCIDLFAASLPAEVTEYLFLERLSDHQYCLRSYCTIFNREKELIT